jgi:hypothetical protein
LKFLTSSGIASGFGPGFAAVVAGSESVGIVSLINKGAVVLDEFLYRRPEAAGKRGKDGFVDDPLSKCPFPRERRTGKDVPERARANLKKRAVRCGEMASKTRYPLRQHWHDRNLGVELSDAQFFGF